MADTPYTRRLPEDMAMLWAACTMCFFGFMHSGEVVTPGEKKFDPAIHLAYGDVTVNSHQDPQYLEVKIKASKNRPLSSRGYDIPGKWFKAPVPSGSEPGIHGRPRLPTSSFL